MSNRRLFPHILMMGLTFSMQMSMLSMRTDESTRADMMAAVKAAGVMTGLYKGVVVALRRVDKASLMLKREDLVELKAVNHTTV